MKTLRILSAALMTVFFLNTSQAQVETDEEDTPVQDTLQTVSLNYEGFTPKWQQDRVVSSPSQRGFHIGIRYQPTFSDIDVATAGGGTVRAGGEIAHGWGVSLNYYFSNHWGTHLEFMNTRHEYTFNDGGRESRVNINYVTMPLLVSWNTDLGRVVNFNVTAGPYLGINTGAGIETSGEDTGEGTAAGTLTGVIHVRPTDIGAAYGAGFDFGFGETRWLHLRIGYRGTAGLIELSDNQANITEDQFNVIISRSKMVTNGAYLGLMFRL
jgi:hypothetical protein